MLTDPVQYSPPQKVFTWLTYRTPRRPQTLYSTARPRRPLLDSPIEPLHVHRPCTVQSAPEGLYLIHLEPPDAHRPCTVQSAPEGLYLTHPEYSLPQKVFNLLSPPRTPDPHRLCTVQHAPEGLYSPRGPPPHTLYHTARPQKVFTWPT